MIWWNFYESNKTTAFRKARFCCNNSFCQYHNLQNIFFPFCTETGMQFFNNFSFCSENISTIREKSALKTYLISDFAHSSTKGYNFLNRKHVWPFSKSICIPELCYLCRNVYYGESGCWLQESLERNNSKHIFNKRKENSV